MEGDGEPPFRPGRRSDPRGQRLGSSARRRRAPGLLVDPRTRPASSRGRHCGLVALASCPRAAPCSIGSMDASLPLRAHSRCTLDARAMHERVPSRHVFAFPACLAFLAIVLAAIQGGFMMFVRSAVVVVAMVWSVV